VGRQIAFVFDLNKCIGCQTCSVACKVLWHQEEPGAESHWWCSVNTLPGRGTPRDWEAMGGGYDGGGGLVRGRLPTRAEFGDPSNYSWSENVEPGMVKWLHLAGGYGHLQYRGVHWQPIPIDRAVHVDVSKA